MKKPIFALAGRPNTGKTTLFNALTGMRQRVANFAGCTVEKAVGIMELEDSEAEIVDLPGTFSVLPVSEDEKVAFRFLHETAVAGRDLQVLCVGEASNLHNCAALALSLKACGYRVALVVNMIDEAELNGVHVNGEKLGEELEMPVFLVSARSGHGLAAIEAFIEAAHERPPAVKPLGINSLHKAKLIQIHESATRRAEECVNRCVRSPRGTILPTIARSIAVDRWLFHPVVGPLILCAALFVVFEALFAIGGPLRDAIANGLVALGNAIRPRMPNELLASLVCDGALAGVAAVASFVPQIAILFALIGLLEASGYLPRAGAMVDRALRPFGLDGKVFIPFLSSFACAIPGVMAARTIPDEKRRLTAVLLSPLMTCSARIPVYTLIIAAFVPASFHPLGLNGQGLVMAGMYVFGVVVALLLALALRATSFFQSYPSPVTVLPPYRWPKAKELARYVWLRCWHFLSKAGQVIFWLSLFLWALGFFPRGPGASLETSYLGHLGRVVEPIFRPIGFDWKLSIAILSSLAAREVFVGTLGTLFALSTGPGASQGLVEALRAAKTPAGLPSYDLATAVSLLLFFAVAMQCVSTIVMVRRETGGWKWPAIQFATFFALAYSLAWTGLHLTRWLAL